MDLEEFKNLKVGQRIYNHNLEMAEIRIASEPMWDQVHRDWYAGTKEWYSSGGQWIRRWLMGSEIKYFSADLASALTKEINSYEGMLKKSRGHTEWVLEQIQKLRERRNEVAVEQT